MTNEYQRAVQIVVSGLQTAARRRQERIDQAIERYEAVVTKLEQDGATLPSSKRVALLSQAERARVDVVEAQNAMSELVALRELAEELTLVSQPGGELHA
jgi:ABC-type molybdenum transport system ATPase subunit/photorepair protein PhrA